jgi:hypothetical protein
MLAADTCATASGVYGLLVERVIVEACETSSIFVLVADATTLSLVVLILVILVTVLVLVAERVSVIARVNSLDFFSFSIS